MAIKVSGVKWHESVEVIAQYTSEQFQKLMADHGGSSIGVSRSGNVWDNAAMERLLRSLKTQAEPHARAYRTGAYNETKVNRMDLVERFFQS